MGYFIQERMFGRLSKIPTANTFNESVGMDSVDYGDFPTSLHIQDTFSRFSAIIFTGAKKKEEQTSEMARGKVIPSCLAVCGAPEIIVVGKDSEFTGEIVQDFCTCRNIVLETVIPGHHQSLGATERRRGHFRTIIDHIIGNKKENS